ncbi:23S rRNA pseudouridine(2604) synthase RluF [Oceanospirillum maris]|uniref:23S rRNA pseudouridine(2604) synthase RluF n=1 Tax=Oceanospirillum maris TaxID=64977 RepID=UPI000413CC69|nr:23S rRNA pseudouridine(2604) synthase RluF [Oceanospirillum maris]
MLNLSLTRLNKYISESGICSRRDADRFIEQGNVYINGKRAQIGDKVSHGDTVKVNGQLIEPPEHDDFIFIAVNKPVGIVSTTESTEKDNIVDFVNHSTRIFPIGRLDKDSQGLIFLTSNGDLVNKVLRAGNNHEKEYLITLDRPISDEAVLGLGNGVPILGTMTKKCPVIKEAPNVIRMTLVQGLNRQIRRMCEYFGYDVVKLERVRIMNVSLKGLAVGDWRDLTEEELSTLLKSVENSSSEAPEGRRKQRPSSSNSNNSKNSNRHSGNRGSGQGQNAKGTSKRPVTGRGTAKGAGKPAVKGAGKTAAKGKRPAAGKGAGRPTVKSAGRPAAGGRAGVAKAKRVGGAVSKGKKPARRG